MQFIEDVKAVLRNYPGVVALCLFVGLVLGSVLGSLA